MLLTKLLLLMCLEFIQAHLSRGKRDEIGWNRLGNNVYNFRRDGFHRMNSRYARDLEIFLSEKSDSQSDALFKKINKIRNQRRKPKYTLSRRKPFFA